MLRQDASCYQQGLVVIMSDTVILASQIRATLLEIAKQANALGVGLQNAAPADKTGAPNNAIQYLLDVAACLTKKAEECDSILR